MQKNFKTYKEQAENDLNAPKQGWLYIQQLLDQQHQQFVLEQKKLKELKAYIKVYNNLLQQWNERVQPNIKALFTDAQDVATVQQIVEVLEKIKTLLETAPASVQQAAQAWSTLIASGKWPDRLKKIQRYHLRSQQRQAAVLGEDGNPKLPVGAIRKNYKYQPPPKKAQLYNKGRGDQHQIAANDVQQGDLDDCFVLGPLAAIAQSDPNALQKLIEIQPDGSYEVTLHLRADPNSLERSPQQVVVKKEFVHTKEGKAAYAGIGDQELWVQVLEKAYAQAIGSFDALAEGGDASETFEVFTGKKATQVALKTQTKEELLKTFEEALMKKIPLVVSSRVFRDSKEILEDGQIVFSNHIYYLRKANSKEVSLNNPQGKDHLKICWKILFDYFLSYFTL
jgi:hypothetical protein